MARLAGTPAQQEAAAGAAGGSACPLCAQTGLGCLEALLHARGQAETCSRQQSCGPLEVQCVDWDHVCMGRGMISHLCLGCCVHCRVVEMLLQWAAEVVQIDTTTALFWEIKLSDKLNVNCLPPALMAPLALVLGGWQCSTACCYLNITLQSWSCHSGKQKPASLALQLLDHLYASVEEMPYHPDMAK